MATIIVRAGDSLQAAINAAVGGDTIQVESNATFTGPFTLPNKAGSSYITIQPSGIASLPADTRVSPSLSVYMYKLRVAGADPVIKTDPSAHHWRIIGADIATSTTTETFDLVKLGGNSLEQTTVLATPHDIEIDRCYLHGGTAQQIQRGIAVNSASTTIKNCYIEKIHGVGYDTQAICGWNGPGPFTIDNNYLEAAGENVMFGGAGSAIEALTPSNVTITRNYLFKPLSWKVGDPSYAGIHWSIKNLLELKNCRTATITGNVLENSWGDAQIGYAVLFTTRNSGNEPWAILTDILFEHNTIINSEQGVQILGQDNLATSQTSHDLTISNNLWKGVANRWFTSTATYNNVVIKHNTHFQGGNIMVLAGTTSSNFVCKDNITVRDPDGFGLFGDGVGEGTVALNTYMPGYTFTKNVYVAANSGIYPATNFYPADVSTVQFVDYNGGNYRLSPSSPYHNAATDGGDIGVDFDALEAAQNGELPPTPLPAPTISTVSPSSGSTAGGTAISIAGTGFQMGATVTVGDTAATGVTVNTSSSISATTPAHAAGTVNVVVTNPDTQSATKSSGFTYVAPVVAPTVTAVSPNLGPLEGGTSVIVIGTGFSAGMTFTLGGSLLTGVMVQSATQATGLTPPHAAGIVDMVATVSGQTGTMVNAFTYVAPPAPTTPVVTACSPISGNVDGGIPVVITGEGFLSGATITFGGTPATGVVLISDTSLLCTNPAHAAGKVNVVVTNTNGKSGSKLNGFQYKKNGRPKNTLLSPNGGLMTL